MSENEAISVKNAANDDINQSDKKGRKNKGPRVSTIDRTREEGEAIIKSLGDVGEVEGRRRTRSAARGVPATPPPAKKERKSSTASGRGRPKKAKDQETDETDSQDESKEPAETDSEKLTAVDNLAAADEDVTKPAETEKQSEPESKDTDARDADTKTNNNSESGNESDSKHNSVDEAEKVATETSENGEKNRKMDVDDDDEEEEAAKDGPTSEYKSSEANDVSIKQNNTSGDAESLKSTTDASDKPAE